MNRYLRRMAGFGKSWAARRSAALARGADPKRLHGRGTPQDVASTRAKTQRHGKVAADKWNQ